MATRARRGRRPPPGTPRGLIASGRSILRYQPNGVPHQQHNTQLSPPINKPAAILYCPPWVNKPELQIKVRGLPLTYTPLQVYQACRRLANIVYIEVFDAFVGQNFTNAKVTFSPAPQAGDWLHKGIRVSQPNGQLLQLVCEILPDRPPRLYKSPKGTELPARMEVNATQIDFGALRDENTMIVMHKAFASNSKTAIAVDMDRQELELSLGVKIRERNHAYRLRLPFTQIKQVHEVRLDRGTLCLYVLAGEPPELSRKAANLESTFDESDMTWKEGRLWFRQTTVGDDGSAKELATRLQNPNVVIDVGRWLSYRVHIDQTASTSMYLKMCQALYDHNIEVITGKAWNTIEGKCGEQWQWLGDMEDRHTQGLPRSTSANLHQLMTSSHLPFPIRFQLEACLSQGSLHECNIGPEFVERLASMEEERAVRLLEKLVDLKQCFYNPLDIFALQASLQFKLKKVPKYCTTIRSAIVTPTTVHYTAPLPETSNRVIRQYSHLQDRFLRVRFTDEQHRGRLKFFSDNRQNEVLTRIKRTMMNGIKVGDRHFEFLAFGNSQFRENGAYFFAPTADVTAQTIRDWMGDFTKMKVIAKYVSRLGQCFSTTRAITSCSVTVKRIPDVKRNGFVFTDGVGKISVFLAIMIAQEFNLPNANEDYPSVFQIRLAGCKGILAVDPTLKRDEVHIRPSQEKFPAKFHGLEICRISQYASAYLNQQIILVLSALGVDDWVFVEKLRQMMADMEAAMSDEEMALKLLQKNIDFNQMTLGVAGMIHDGFMAVQEPFMMSCLRLWRSWNMKYLKEKARILVESGVFLLGCVDETATLNGHFDNKARPGDSSSTDLADLPEVFLQIPDPETSGKYQVVTGVCIVLRNPSLHPGDIRVVRAVDNTRLRHLKNCLVFPQTGDRDVPNMCSGGDLDGDDFLVIWDSDLLPAEWNHPPMDFTAPKPAESQDPVTVDAMTSFFVTHMKNDNLGQIATAHRYQADRQDAGVKDAKCIRLAELHSQAVDYCKSGIPASMDRGLRPKSKPHWAVRSPNEKCYKSDKILGRLYDDVQRIPFVPAWDLTFDQRILKAYELDEEILADARSIKQQYDEAVLRIKTQHGIGTEFEVWTTFVLDHNNHQNDYKFAETFGEIVYGLKQVHQDLCFEKAGTTPKERDWAKMGPFIAAMYTVTAQEVQQALRESREMTLVAGQYRPKRQRDASSMPLISFPWIFARELGQIATGKTHTFNAMPLPTFTTARTLGKKAKTAVKADYTELPELPVVVFDDEVIREGDLLDLGHSTSRIDTPTQLSPSKQSLDQSQSATKHAPDGHDIPAAPQAFATPIRTSLEDDVFRPNLCTTKSASVNEVMASQNRENASPPARAHIDFSGVSGNGVVITRENLEGKTSISHEEEKQMQVLEKLAPRIDETAPIHNSVASAGIIAGQDFDDKDGTSSDDEHEEVILEVQEMSSLDKLAALVGI